MTLASKARLAFAALALSGGFLAASAATSAPAEAGIRFGVRLGIVRVYRPYYYIARPRVIVPFIVYRVY